MGQSQTHQPSAESSSSAQTKGFSFKSKKRGQVLRPNRDLYGFKKVLYCSVDLLKPSTHEMLATISQDKPVTPEMLVRHMKSYDRCETVIVDVVAPAGSTVVEKDHNRWVEDDDYRGEWVENPIVSLRSDTMKLGHTMLDRFLHPFAGVGNNTPGTVAFLTPVFWRDAKTGKVMLYKPGETYTSDLEGEPSKDGSGLYFCLDAESASRVEC